MANGEADGHGGGGGDGGETGGGGWGQTQATLVVICSVQTSDLNLRRNAASLEGQCVNSSSL